MKYSFLILAALLATAPLMEWLGPAPMPLPSDVFAFDGHTFYIPDVEQLAVSVYLKDAIEADGLDWGDAVVVAQEKLWVGAAQADHELAGLHGNRLRTHGGFSEQDVPFILSRPLNEAYAKRAGVQQLRNYHIFDFAVNGTI